MPLKFVTAQVKSLFFINEYEKSPLTIFYIKNSSPGIIGFSLDALTWQLLSLQKVYKIGQNQVK